MLLSDVKSNVIIVAIQIQYTSMNILQYTSAMRDNGNLVQMRELFCC